MKKGFFTILTFMGAFQFLSAQVIFSEDFEGAVEPSTDLPTGWTETGASTDGIWSTATSGEASSAYLTFPAPSVGTIFAYTNDDDCNCDKSADRLILPAQNFSSYSNLQLVGDFYLNGGYGETMVCEVSTDGGSNWTPIYTFVGNATAWEEDVQIDLSSYDGESNVLISFLYSDVASWAYAGGVDNIIIQQLVLSEDLAIHSIPGEYSIIPLNLAQEMNLSAMVVNNGSDSVLDATVTSNVYLNGSLDQSTNNSSSIAGGDTVNIATGSYTPSMTGDYIIEYIVSSVSITDTDPLNDTLRYEFSVDENYYARDKGAPNIFFGFGASLGGTVGNLFEITSEVTLDSVMSRHNLGVDNLGDTTYYEVYNVVNGVPTTVIGRSPFHIIDNNDTGVFKRLILPVMDLNSNPLVLSAGTYLVGVAESTNGANISLAGHADIFVNNTVLAYINNTWAPVEQLLGNHVASIRPRFNICHTLMTSTFVDSNISCNGGSDGGVTASATGGTPSYTYLWSNSATTASITGVAAGTYTVTITDDNGCITSSDETVTEPALLSTSTSIDSNISCNGGSDGGITASTSGGTNPYSYAWSNSATTASITGVAAGTYTVTITDANGCTASSDSTVTEPTALGTATADNGDGSVVVTAFGGTSPYTYLWDASAGNQTTDTALGLSTGTYYVTVTDANGCTSEDSISITVTGVLEIAGSSFSIFPNPTHDIINVDFPLISQTGFASVRIIDLSGRTVFYNETVDFSKGVFEINVSNLSPALYNIELRANNQVFTNKISVIK